MRGLGCAKFADGAGIYMISTDIENLFKCNILDSHSSNQDNFHSSHSNLHNCSSV